MLGKQHSRHVDIFEYAADRATYVVMPVSTLVETAGLVAEREL